MHSRDQAATPVMTLPHIVIVTYNWPPRNAIGTHRTYSWARYWRAAGARVTVLTARKQAFDEPLDLHLERPAGVEVVDVPYAGVAGSWLGRLTGSAPIRRGAKAINRWLARHRSGPVDPRAGWRAAASTDALRLAGDADIVVSTYGPAAAHLIACDMKRANPALTWVADYRDLWSQCPTGTVSEAARARMRDAEIASVGAHADLLTAVSDDMVQRLRDLTGKRVVRITNGFDLDELQVRKRLADGPGRPENPFRIVHTGRIYEGERDPVPLLDALVRLDAAGLLGDLTVTVDFYGAQVGPVGDLLGNARYARFLRLMGHVPRDQALEAQRRANLLLLLESSAPEARGVLTGKVFEYISAGRPVLCVGSRPDFEIGQLLADTGTGMVIGPEQREDLDDLLLETFRGGGLYARYQSRVDAVLCYSRQGLAKQFLDILLTPSAAAG